MQVEILKKIVIDCLEAAKAKDITVLDVRTTTNITDYMIICTSGSARHGTAIADRLFVATKAAGIKPFSMEGETTGDWILVDLLDILVHIMLPEARDLYKLEQLWQGHD